MESNLPAISDLLIRDPRSLAKVVTLLESYLPQDRFLGRKILEELWQIKKAKGQKSSIRVGFSGIPGVGKSSLINEVGLYFLKNLSCELGVVSVDPSSPLYGGSILGDKIRMQELTENNRVFMRPSANRGMGGGVSPHLEEVISLLEACGFEWIFVESVGVGQSEYDLASMVDIFVLVQMPATGDEIQSIKKGILELPDVIVIHKADGDLLERAKILKSHIEQTLHQSFYSFDNFSKSKPFVQNVSSKLQTGVKELAEILFKLEVNLRQVNFRQLQQIKWAKKAIWNEWNDRLKRDPRLAQAEKEVIKQISLDDNLASILAASSLLP